MGPYRLTYKLTDRQTDGDIDLDIFIQTKAARINKAPQVKSGSEKHEIIIIIQYLSNPVGH